MSNKKAVPLGANRARRNGQLTETDIHDVLRNERRYLALKHLYRSGGEMGIRELSERIAEDETSEDPAPRDVRESVYSSLHQTHLPKLDELDIITYHKSSKVIELEDRSRSVMCYMDLDAIFGLTWIQCLAGISLLGFVVVAAASLGIPGISRLHVAVWAVIFLSLIVVSIQHRARQRNRTPSSAGTFRRKVKNALLRFSD